MPVIASFRLFATTALLALAAPAIAQSRPAAVAPQMQSATPREMLWRTDLPAANGGTLVLALANAAALDRVAGLDAATKAALTRAATSADYRYAARATQSLRGIGGWDRILLVGRGEGAGAAAPTALGQQIGRATLSDRGAVTVLAEGMSAAELADLATGLRIGSYRSDLYRARTESAARGALTIVASDASNVERAYSARGAAIAEAVDFTRNLINAPGNIIYPESFVERTREAFAGLPGVTIEALDVPAMERLGMGALLSVGQGSQRPPRLLVVRYRGPGATGDAPVVLAGKGITFDSGGISIKSGAGMGDMKMDMSGAAAVTGAVLALARGRAPVNVVAIAALAENLPSGTATRPGDVVRAMNGRTIEIVNTDAEGRVVLADALAWANANLRPAAVVDVATLTGAIGTALGDDYAGLFSRHDGLARQLETAGTAAGEPMWRMPLHPSVGDDVKSTIADLKNSGGGGAGASFGAWFIGEFLPRETPWAHIDMANVAWGSASDTHPGGAHGWGVRTLERFVRDFRSEELRGTETRGAAN